MDRRVRTKVGAALLGLATAAAGGCRSTKPEVPPAKAFSAAGQPSAPLAFGSSPGQNAFSALSGTNPNPETIPGRSGGQFGTPAPGNDMYGAPTDNTFGPPGTNGLAAGSGAPAASQPPSNAASGLSGMGYSMPPMTNPSVGIPQTGTGSTGPAAGIAAPPAASSSLNAPTQSPFQ
jgi:hypothetical protein